MFGNHFDDQLRCDFARLVRRDNILKLLLGNVHGDVRFLKVRVGEQLV